MDVQHHSTITLDEALAVLRNAGYLVEPTKQNLPELLADIADIARDKPWILSTPLEDLPGSYEMDWISERDLLMQAQAVRDHIVCAFCGQPAESHCPDCGTWTCYEDRRDFPPNFDDHLCGPCVQRRSAQAAYALHLATKEVK